jgi:two-component system, OmpR family, response regulator QseB
MRVLLVEDDEMLGEVVRNGLIHYGYTVDWVQDGQAAQQALLTEGESFDIVVLDIGLPRKSGLEVLKTIRGKSITTPVMILTARETVEDRVKGLDAGADDYLLKPFDLEELCARMRALQRRTSSRAEPTLIHDNITIDPAAHTVALNDEDVKISRREFVLLLKLIENAGRVLSREHLTSSLYGWGDEIDSNALEVHIHNLRKKFGTNLIRTIRGVGYMVDKPK